MIALNHRLPAVCKTLLLLLLMTFLSCEEAADWDLQTEVPQTLVVEAQLTNELKYQHIYLSRPFGMLNDEAAGVSGAQVMVQAGNQAMVFQESSEKAGHYFSQVPVSTSIGVDYVLNIETEGKHYQAHTYMVPVLPSAGPQWVYHEENGLYSIQWPAGPYNPFEQAMYEAIISWDHLVGSNPSDTLTSVRLLYYTFNTIDVSYSIFPQDEEAVYFPRNSMAIVKKYSLNEEHAAYLRALLAEAEWQGSLFEDARGNLPTNISNGGLGFFSASSVLSDTLIVN